ncbi:thiamine pyrophosphate-binding protein [Micromonospora sp. BRA006-A]|nr:thiamine pyrophosphate-binding protein [Micromonospora sp. BRA006-A]
MRNGGSRRWRRCGGDHDLLRALGLTTVFGNPGSTEEPFLQHFPDDFHYVHALQEASAVAMADGYAQAPAGPRTSTCTPRRAPATAWATWSPPGTTGPR